MLKSRIISIGMLVLFCVIFWNTIDLVYTFLIAHRDYSFSVFNDICLPIVIGMTVGCITNLRKEKSDK